MIDGSLLFEISLNYNDGNYEPRVCNPGLTFLTISICRECWCSVFLLSKPKNNSIISDVSSYPTKRKSTLTNKYVYPGDNVSRNKYNSPTNSCLIHTWSTKYLLK